MTWFFIVVLALFCAMETLLLIKFSLNKKILALKSSSISSGLFLLLIVAICIFRLNIPEYILILTLASLFINSYFGFYLNYYNKSKIFDRFLHAYSSFTFSLLFYYLLINIIGFGQSKISNALVILLLGISLGAVYEIIEFAADKKHHSELQRGLTDTDFDIIFDIIGAFAAAVFAYIVIFGKYLPIK